jgi:hypothetical protein
MVAVFEWQCQSRIDGRRASDCDHYVLRPSPPESRITEREINAPWRIEDQRLCEVLPGTAVCDELPSRSLPPRVATHDRNSVPTGGGTDSCACGQMSELGKTAKCHAEIPIYGNATTPQLACAHSGTAVRTSSMRTLGLSSPGRPY